MKRACLSLLKFPEQNTIDWVAYTAEFYVSQFRQLRDSR